MRDLPRKIGILAGGGSLPGEIAAACAEQRLPYFLLRVDGAASFVPGGEHATVRLGAIARALHLLRQHQVTDLVMAGWLRRPTLRSLRPDAKAMQWLWRLGLSFFKGDNRLLRDVAILLEGEGFRVIGAETLLVQALVEKGILGQHSPSEQDRADLRCAFEAAKAIGQRDRGQAAMARGARLLGVEDRQGTDALIARCASQPGSGGVLVKAAKPGQERRADLPAIGPETVARLKEAGFHGIGLEAGSALILRRAETIAAADAAGLFLYGLNEVGE